MFSCLKSRKSDKKLSGTDLADTLIYQKNTNGVSVAPPGYKLATVAQCQANLSACKAAVDGDGTWAICSLADGKVSGSGYGYSIQNGSYPNQGCAVITPAPSCPNGLPVVASGAQCGPGKGCCPKGECCSQYGWCNGGNTGAASAPWCGAGCQKGYGACGTPAPLIFQKNPNGISAAPPGYKLATMAQCQSELDACKAAVDGDGAWAICTLADGKVSGSGYGYSIQSGSYPNQGCAIITPATTSSCPNGLPTVGSGQQCGAGKGCCPAGECCSQYGWCSGGNTGAASAPWCGAGCQPSYGKCGV